MAKVRAYKLAEELGLERDELIAKAAEAGIEIRSPHGRARGRGRRPGAREAGRWLAGRDAGEARRGHGDPAPPQGDPQGGARGRLRRARPPSPGPSRPSPRRPHPPSRRPRSPRTSRRRASCRRSPRRPPRSPRCPRRRPRSPPRRPHPPQSRHPPPQPIAPGLSDRGRGRRPDDHPGQGRGGSARGLPAPAAPRRGRGDPGSPGRGGTRRRCSRAPGDGHGPVRARRSAPARAQDPSARAGRPGPEPQGAGVGRAHDARQRPGASREAPDDRRAAVAPCSRGASEWRARSR